MQHQTFKRFLADIGVTIIMCSKEENIKQRTNLEVDILFAETTIICKKLFRNAPLDIISPSYGSFLRPSWHQQKRHGFRKKCTLLTKSQYR